MLSLVERACSIRAQSIELSKSCHTICQIVLCPTFSRTSLQFFFVNPLSPTTNLDRFSQYTHNTKQTSDENKEKYRLGDYWLIQFQILQTNITKIIQQTVRRITYEILRAEGLVKKEISEQASQQVAYQFVNIPILVIYIL